MKIKSIETFSTRNISIVRVKTDDGFEGYGQLATYHANISAMVLHQQVAPYALGADAERIADLVDKVVEGEHKFPGSYVCRAVGGLDTALWDLHGKRAGLSVCELLGGSRVLSMCTAPACDATFHHPTKRSGCKGFKRSRAFVLLK